MMFEDGPLPQRRQGSGRLTVRFRSDGWPLCPSCGADELMSAEIPPKRTDVLQCLACMWRGVVPRPHE